MPVRNLDKIFRPRRVAVIGASNTPGSVGHGVFANLIGSGFEGVVYPVNPRHEAVQGVQAYADVSALPQTPDLAVVCTRAATVPDVVRQCGEAGILGLIIVSAGFGEIGDEGKQLEDRVRQTAAEFDGMRILGPNCLGILVPGSGLNASFAAAMPKPGHLAFISQSGALCTSVLDWALEENIGFSHFVSVGNMLDVSIADLIDYFAADGQTRAILLYVESITEPREFMSAARAFARQKPIVAYKAGRFAQSAQAAASHTGAMAGVDAVYEAAFQRAGIVRVFAVDAMFDCAELLARQPVPGGARLAIVTNAGGPGVMATDALIARQGTLAELSDSTLARLDAELPPHWSRGNPVDVLGDAPPARFAGALELVLADQAVDAALVILTPQSMTSPTETAQAVADVAARHRKPVLTSWMGGATVRQGVERLNRASLPTYDTPEKAVEAFMYLVAYARNRTILYETPRDIPLAFPHDREKLRAIVLEQFGNDGDGDMLREENSKALLEAYGIPTTRPHPAATADEAVEIARRLGYPVVLKIRSPQITHKTDVGGVVLNVMNDDAVRTEFERIVAAAAAARPDATIEGVTVQRMFVAEKSVEMIVGAKKDPVFGAVLLAGFGGVAAEVFEDRALALPPLNERLARRMLESLRSWPLLCGYRGRPPMAIDRLIEMLMRISYLVAENPEIQELDVNPLLVTPKEVIAVDARVIVDRAVLAQPVRPYAHLAIRPYPEEFVRGGTLKDGTPVVLRPVRPEDEPLWHDLLARCSEQSLWFRFRYLFKETTHEMASRFCYLDYDRELAIVAELDTPEGKQLIGVGRLVADPDHHTAEYAVLVADAWQSKGLGSLLTDYCTEIAARWQLKRVCGETTSDNVRMIATFRKWGFAMRHHEKDPTTIVATRELV